MHTADHPVLEDELGTYGKSARKTLTLNRHHRLQGPLLGPVTRVHGLLTYLAPFYPCFFLPRGTDLDMVGRNALVSL